MNRMTRLIAPVTAAAGLACSALGQPIEVKDRNAALAYWAAWSFVNPKATTLISEIDWKKVGTTTDGKAMPAEFLEYTKLEGADAGVSEIIEASKLKKCDFEIRYSMGFQALLPHLGKARNGVRVLRAEARERTIAGNAEGAAECIAAMIRCGNHMGNDQILISSLVGYACINAAIDEAGALKAGGKMTDKARAIVLESLKEVNAKDPARVSDAIKFETSVWGTIDRMNFKGPQAGAEAAAYFHDLGGMNNDMRRNADDPLKSLEALDERAFKADLANLKKGGEAVREAWASPDGVRKLDELEASIKAGAYGVLAQVIMPALGRARQQTDDMTAKLEKTITEFGGK